jgi:hypothetical protein
VDRVIFNDYLDATLAFVFAAIVVATVIYGLIDIRSALRTPKITAIEVGAGGATAGGGE